VTAKGTILALNCGSSSIKFAAFDGACHVLHRGQVENIGDGLSPRLIDDSGAHDLSGDLDTHAGIVGHLLHDVIMPRFGNVRGVGHRVVHGGTAFGHPAVIDGTVRAEIAALSPLAPSHQPHNLAGIDAVSNALPGVPQVACFDTAFHRTIPEHRQLMALPRSYAEQGLRRFGCHGLSYQSSVARLPEATSGRRVVICHLGNGCSLAGVVDGQSAWTSMGFTPLDGLVMGRRPGRLDPGAVLWLVRHHDGDLEAVDRILNRESGLLGISGVSSDMRVLLEDDGEEARLAVTMFVDRLVQEIGTAIAAIGGLDAIVFAGGIGENSAAIRTRTLEALAWAGFQINEEANAGHALMISDGTSHPSAHVIATDEEAVIARAVLDAPQR
jgi:acetate kinase